MNFAGELAGALALMLTVIAVAAGLGRYVPFYQRELAVGQRELALDGLRGLAALMVMTHHSFHFHRWLTTGIWGNAGNGPLQLMGPAGVIIFFMLTGHLFWGKARAANGKLNAWKLWRGRFLRIAPLYFFSLLLVLLVALLQAGAQWLAPANWPALLRLLPLGAVDWRLVGGADLGSYNADVVWTLWYEWRFYLLLPFLAWFAVGRRIIFPALLLYMLGFTNILFQPKMEFVLVFFLGMLCPLLTGNKKLRDGLRHPATAVAALAWLVGACIWSDWNLSGVLLAGAFFPAFLAAAASNDFFGSLSHPATRCLGAISFSLYLLHGVVFHLVIGTMKAGGLTTLTSLEYWFAASVTAMATALLCAGTYRWIEFPFLSASHKIQAKPTA
ncbi:MAG: hypothetical protein RL616_2063 [Verrucomicrobiota bacterium]